MIYEYLGYKYAKRWRHSQSREKQSHCYVYYRLSNLDLEKIYLLNETQILNYVFKSRLLENSEPELTRITMGMGRDF